MTISSDFLAERNLTAHRSVHLPHQSCCQRGEMLSGNLMTEQTLEVSVIPIFMSSQIRSILQLGSIRD
jgi:hypothetical protein